jgi:hypothetical protein
MTMGDGLEEYRSHGCGKVGLNRRGEDVRKEGMRNVIG